MYQYKLTASFWTWFWKLVYWTWYWKLIYFCLQSIWLWNALTYRSETYGCSWLCISISFYHVILFGVILKIVFYYRLFHLSKLPGCLYSAEANSENVKIVFWNLNLYIR
jgi:hypothetical protein